MSFIEDYLLYSSGNKAPKLFHQWSAISTLSSVVGRRVWISQGHWKRYPNLYVILVGDPANGKSTAMKIAQNLLIDLKDVPLGPSSITKERLTKLLGEEGSRCHKRIMVNGEAKSYTHLSVFSNEMLTLLGRDPLSMIDFLTDVWDCEKEFAVETKNQGCDIIKAPFITVLACMTPEKTTNLLKQNIIDGGFSRRCVFVYNNRRGKATPRPIITKEQYEAKERCLVRLRQIRQVNGEFVWTKETEEFFDDWFENNQRELDTKVDLVTQGYFGCKDELLLKVTMLLTVAETDERTLELSRMQRALDLLKATEKTLHLVFSGMGENRQARIGQKILNMLLHTNEPVKEKRIYAELFSDGDREQIQQTLHHLEQIDKIKQVTKGSVRYWEQNNGQ